MLFTQFKCNAKSFANITKRMGPKIEPCGTPTFIDTWLLVTPEGILTLCFLSPKYDFIKSRATPLMPYLCNLFKSNLWSTVSNAELKSTKRPTAKVFYLSI